MGAVVDRATELGQTLDGIFDPIYPWTRCEGRRSEQMIMDQARRRAGRKPVDMKRVRETQADAMLVKERAERTERARKARMDEIRRRTPANLRQYGRYS